MLIPNPEHDGNAEYIDYVSGVGQEISGLTSNRIPSKASFLRSKWEKLQVGRFFKTSRMVTSTWMVVDHVDHDTIYSSHSFLERIILWRPHLLFLSLL